MQQEEKERALCNLEIIQVQHTTDERELLETIMLLRKAQQGPRYNSMLFYTTYKNGIRVEFLEMCKMLIKLTFLL